LNKIATSDLKRMKICEGLILQGCGGDLQKWVDGINEQLTKENILLDDSKFSNVSTFEHDGLTNLLFPFEDAKIDVGKLAMWRLRTHEQLGGTWLSDYPSRLGGFVNESSENQKPDCPLIEADGNIFNLMGIARNTLRENGMQEQAKAMCDRITSSGNYDNALCIIGEYVNITSADDMNEDYDENMGGMEL